MGNRGKFWSLKSSQQGIGLVDLMIGVGIVVLVGGSIGALSYSVAQSASATASTGSQVGDLQEVVKLVNRHSVCNHNFVGRVPQACVFDATTGNVTSGGTVITTLQLPDGASAMPPSFSQPGHSVRLCSHPEMLQYVFRVVVEYPETTRGVMSARSLSIPLNASFDSSGKILDCGLGVSSVPPQACPVPPTPTIYDNDTFAPITYTYTNPGTGRLQIQCWGGGGGGAAGHGTDFSAGGGGGGGYAEITIPAATAGATISLVVGERGHGEGGSYCFSGCALPGGTTTIPGVLSAAGGTPSVENAAIQSWNGGMGGAGTILHATITGMVATGTPGVGGGINSGAGGAGANGGGRGGLGGPNGRPGGGGEGSNGGDGEAPGGGGGGCGGGGNGGFAGNGCATFVRGTQPYTATPHGGAGHGAGGRCIITPLR